MQLLATYACISSIDELDRSFLTPSKAADTSTSIMFELNFQGFQALQDTTSESSPTDVQVGKVDKGSSLKKTKMKICKKPSQMKTNSPCNENSRRLVQKATSQGAKHTVGTNKQKCTKAKCAKTRIDEAIRTPVNTTEFLQSGQGSRLKKATNLLSELNILTPKIILLSHNDYLLMDKNTISHENTEFLSQIKSIGNKLIDAGKTMLDFAKKLDCKLKTKSNELREQVQVIHVPSEGENKHAPKKIKMEVCNTDSEKEFERLDTLTIQKFPKEKAMYNKKGGKYQCHQCNDTFRGHSDLRNHISSKHSDLSYICDQCNKTFSSEKSFKNHMAGHKSGGHKCYVCSKEFLLKSSLINHSKIHTGERYACDICGKSYASYAVYLDHTQNGHTEEKSVKCYFCGMFFQTKWERNNHIRDTHTAKAAERQRKKSKLRPRKAVTYT